MLGFAFGWGDREALVIAGAVAISSSAIVTKLLTELRRLGNRETPLILGIIVVEDVFLALYLAVVQPILSDATGTEIIVSIASAFGFLLGFAIIARFASGLVRRLLDAESDELLIVCVVGLVVLAAGVAEEVGVSDAIAALLVGLVVAETGLTRRVEHLVLPLRDTFGAIFFFVFGVSIQPDLIVDVIGPILIAVVASLAVNVVAGLVVARRAAHVSARRAAGRAHRAGPRRVLADPRRAGDRRRPRRPGHRVHRRATCSCSHCSPLCSPPTPTASPEGSGATSPLT